MVIGLLQTVVAQLYSKGIQEAKIRLVTGEREYEIIGKTELCLGLGVGQQEFLFSYLRNFSRVVGLNAAFFNAV